MQTHSHHTHAVPEHSRAGAPGTKLGLVLAFTVCFMVVEVVGGLLSGSLALLADAGHMLTDSLAISLSWGAIWLARRKTTSQRTYGFRRAEILAAFVNAFVLLLLALWIVKEAVERVYSPQPVHEGILFWVALAGLGVNLVGFLLLRREAEGNLNLRSALWHIIGDMLGSLGAISAALVIHFTGYTVVDPMISIGIALLIGVGSGRILYDSTNLLLDSVPDDIDSPSVRKFLASQTDVQEICDLHIWAISGTENMLTAHLVVKEEVERDAFLHRISEELKHRFKLDHLTIQLECNPTDACHEDW